MTEQAKYTPGPWTVDLNALHVEALGPNGYMRIADVRGWGYLTGKGHGALGLDPQEAVAIQTANARLITAAPDMYEELKSLMEDRRIALGSTRRKRIAAVTAKAEGR